MLHQDFYVYTVVLPNVSRSFTLQLCDNGLFAFSCIPWLCDCCSAGDLVSFTDILVSIYFFTAWNMRRLSFLLLLISSRTTFDLFSFSFSWIFLIECKALFLVAFNNFAFSSFFSFSIRNLKFLWWFDKIFISSLYTIPCLILGCLNFSELFIYVYIYHRLISNHFDLCLFLYFRYFFRFRLYKHLQCLYFLDIQLWYFYCWMAFRNFSASLW